MITKKHNIHHSYMQIATTWAEGQSYATRRKVGAIIVKDGTILSHGHNGTISGFSNRCEDDEGNTNTDHILHAESNAILKVAQSTNSTKGATLYSTDAPCIDCAKLIIQSGIKTVYYQRNYRGIGIDTLLIAGIEVFHIDTEGNSRKYDLMKDNTFFKSGNKPLIMKMDHNVVELFKAILKPYKSGYGNTLLEYHLDYKFKISVRLKPTHTINPDYVNLEHLSNDISEDGYINTVIGLVGYGKKQQNESNYYCLITPQQTEYEDKTLHFFAFTKTSTDRSDYGESYGCGKIPFSAIESIKIENNL